MSFRGRMRDGMMSMSPPERIPRRTCVPTANGRPIDTLALPKANGLIFGRGKGVKGGKGGEENLSTR